MQFMTPEKRRILEKLVRLANGDAGLVHEAVMHSLTDGNVIDAGRLIEYIKQKRPQKPERECGAA